MSNASIQKWLGAVLCVLALGSTAALAEPDTFGLGSGRDGPLTVSTLNRVINSYAQVTEPLAPGDTSLEVASSTGFEAGALVLVLRTTGLLPAPASGDSTPVNLHGSGNPVGRWELARLASVSGTTLTLTAPLVQDYAALVTQVILVPEYTDVTIQSSRGLSAKAWDGSTGGVLAFLSQGPVVNSGTLSASRLGFQGGKYGDDDGLGSQCNGLDEPPERGAQKGEGLASTRYGSEHTGYGNVANGGGGGVCVKSGGGGGGGGGPGGRGGHSDFNDGGNPYGGLGGAAVDGPLLFRLTLGGGGGAGHGDSGTGVPGGRGGGIVFIRARQLSGTGSILAHGESAGVASSDASSGGGAGGTLYLRFSEDASCANANSLGAKGGIGGNSGISQVGPGGGGGGGRVLLQAASGTCGSTTNLSSNNVGGASAGTQQDPFAQGGVNYGAQPGSSGVFQLLSSAFVVPQSPTVNSPADGSFISTRQPDIKGKAEANTDVVIYIDGVAVGVARSNAAGDYVFALSTPLSEASHTVEAATELNGVQSPRSPVNTFTVDVVAPVQPVVLAPAQGAVTPDSTPVFTGTAEPGSVVTVLIDGVEHGPVTADPDGNWSYTPTTPLDDGGHTVKAQARDVAGNVSLMSDTHSFQVDTSTPAAPTVLSPAEGASTADSTPAITGTAEPGSRVTVLLNGVEYGPVTADASGQWSYTPTSPLPEGPNEVRARATDEVGNTGPVSEGRTFTVGETPPDAPAPPEAPAPSVDRAFRGDGLSCAATGGEASLVLLGLGAFAALARRRRRR